MAAKRKPPRKAAVINGRAVFPVVKSWAVIDAVNAWFRR